MPMKFCLIISASRRPTENLKYVSESSCQKLQLGRVHEGFSGVQEGPGGSENGKMAAFLGFLKKKQLSGNFQPTFHGFVRS